MFLLTSTSSILIVLREHHAQAGVDDTKHDGVGQHLDQVGRTGRQGQEDAGAQQNKQNNGHENIGVNHFCIYPLKNISQKHHNLMVKALANLTARIVCAHREMTPYIGRIHSGFMVERSIQAVEEDIQKMQEMLRQVRETLNAPKTNQDHFIPLK